MTKKDDNTLTDDEMKVLTLLERNAKKSIDEVAKKCGFSRQKVWRIVKQLEERQIIWGYTAVTDETAKNMKLFIVLVKRNTVPFSKEVREEILTTKIDEPVSSLVTVENIYFTHGTADWVMTFYATDLVAAKMFVEKTFRRLGDYIQDFSILESIASIRKMGLKNPQMKQIIDYI